MSSLWVDQYVPGSSSSSTPSTGSGNSLWVDQYIPQTSTTPEGPIQGTPQSSSFLAPTSVAQSQQNGGGVWDFIKDFAGNAVKEIPRDIGNIAKVVGEGTVGAGENIANDTGVSQFNTPQQKIADAIPKAIEQIPGQALNFGKEVVNNPKQALYDAGNSVYEDPIQALLTASGVGDLLSGGIGVAGDIADAAATNAAASAAELSPEEAASAVASRGVTQGGLSNASDTIGSTAASLNPINQLFKVADKAQTLGGNATTKIASTINRSGETGSQALKDIAGGGDIGDSAASGMRGNPTTEESQAFKDAVNSIDTKNTENGAQFGPEEMQNVKNNIVDTLANKGVKLNIMDPQDLDTITNEYNNGGLTNKTDQIIQKYFGNPTSPDTSYASTGIPKTKFVSSSSVPSFTSQQTQSMVEEAIKNGGLLGIKDSEGVIPKVSGKNLQNVMENIVRPVFQTGSQGGYDATAENLNELKIKAKSLFTPSSPLNPISNDSKAMNALSTELSGHITNPLMQYPEYQDVMNRYKSYYGGQSLNKLTPSSIQELFNGNTSIPIDAAAVYGLTKLLGPIAGGAFGLLSSPRLAGEAADIYSKIAPVGGAIVSPVREAASQGALTALLNSIKSR